MNFIDGNHELCLYLAIQFFFAETTFSTDSGMAVVSVWAIFRESFKMAHTLMISVEKFPLKPTTYKQVSFVVFTFFTRSSANAMNSHFYTCDNIK
jgi:hypothetical protein